MNTFDRYVKIEFGTKDVPLKMLEQAEKDPKLTGVVLSKKGQQLSVTVNDVLIGFLTPRQEKGVWRTGAIYITPKYRGIGLGTKIITQFFSDKDRGVAVIETDNYPSQKAFEKAGFTKGNKLTHDGIDYDVWRK